MRNKKILLNKQTLFLGIFSCVLVIIFGGGVAFLIAVGIASVKTESDRVFCSAFMGISTVSYIIAFLFCLPRIYAYLRLDKDGIEYKKAFSKKEIIPYKKYRYVYMGSYFHRGIFPIGYQRRFIVLSQVYISPPQLNHVNHIKNSTETIVLEYNKKTVNYLQNMLPYKQKYMLEQITNNETGDTSLS